jgi:hypothetical protein
VLAIGVRRDHAGRVWKMDQRVVQAGLQRGAFAQIDRVRDQVDAIVERNAAKRLRIFGTAAVVHHYDRVGAESQKFVDDSKERVARFIGRDQDRDCRDRFFVTRPSRRRCRKLKGRLRDAVPCADFIT